MALPSGTFQLSPIKAMELAAAKIPGVVSLAQGIPSFNTPNVIRDFVIDRIRADACDKYSLTIGLAELREEIGLALQSEGLKYDPDREILVTAGSIEGISAAVLSCTEPGDEVLLPTPAYASYQGAVGMARCTVRWVPLDEDNNFDFHIDALERAITRRTKAILYASPNNPTGTLFSEAKTRALVTIALRHNLTVIVDEVYKDFYYTNDKHFTPASIPEARNNVIRVCSFSKAYSMTGWRVGFLHSSAERVSAILKYHDAMVTCAPVISQYAAIAALRFGQPFLNSCLEEFRRRRAYTINVLDSLSHVLDYQNPKGSYFVFPRIKDTVPLARDSTKLAYDILERARVALVPGSAFGPSGEGHLRISFGREMRDIEVGLQRFAEYLGTSRRQSLPSVQPTQKSLGRSLLRRVGIRFIGTAAQHYIARSKPIIIGIAGVHGKTVVKRALVESLSKRLVVRGGRLSYNTASGLPLAILDLPAPLSTKDRLLLPLRALLRALRLTTVKCLIVEYGVAQKGDAELLLKIARPDYLVLTDLATDDPAVHVDVVETELRVLSDAADALKITYAADDNRLQAMLAGRLGTTALDLTAIGGEDLGRSDKLAEAAARWFDGKDFPTR